MTSFDRCLQAIGCFFIFLFVFVAAVLFRSERAGFIFGGEARQSDLCACASPPISNQPWNTEEPS